MKKITILAAIAAASLAVFSCAQVEQDVLTKDGVFVLSLDSGEMETRTVDTNFETAIDHFDYFFFSDAEGTTPIAGMHGRAEGSSKVLDTQVGAEFEALRSITSYVYVLANYPTALDHSSDWVLDDILALDVTSPIATAVNEETGAVTFTDNLVMDSWRVESDEDVYTVELTPTKIQEERDVTVPLARLAAKINVHVTVTPSVTVAGYEWKSRPELLQGYYVNSLNNKATVAGTPVKRSEIPEASVDDYQYLTYPTTYPFDPAPAEDVYEYDLDPVYTYPQEWSSDDNGEPYFKFQMPWINERDDEGEGGTPSMGSSNFYYKVTVPKPDSGTWTIKRNTCYQVDLTLSMLNTPDDYIEVQYGITIVPWADSGRPGGSGLSAARFFSVPTKVFELYNEESLDIPFASSSAVKAYFTEIKYQFFGTNAGATYTFSYTESDNKTNFTLPTRDSGNQSVNSHATDTHPYAVSVSGKNVHFTHELANIFTVREIKLVIKSESGQSEEVIIRQHPAIEIKKHPTMNMFINGWFGHVKDPMDAEGNPFAEHITYTDRYGNTVSKASVGRTNTASYIETSPYFNVYGYYGALASNQNTFITEPYITEVVVTAFSESNHTYKIRYGEDPGASDHDLVNPGPVENRSYIIGDPRVKASAAGKGSDWLQSGYLYRENYTYNTQGAVTGYTEDIRSWDRPEEIMIGSTSVDARSFVAPRFLLASTLNVTNGVGFATAQRRAAVYQEEGYPAGRWRLPTEAEICFIIDRQNDGSLPQLLRATQWYWSADGNVIYTGSGATTVPGSAPRPTKSAPLRFIYDLWYWGDADPNLETNVYHPNMHLVAPNPEP